MINQEQKERLIEQLKKTPIVQIACEKAEISRATYYRWRKEDKEFAKITDEALSEGATLVSDIAESQLLSLIKDKNLTAIIFWLKHHHASYTTRVEVNAKIQQSIEELTPEQQEVVTKALRLASLAPQGEPSHADM